MKTKDNIKITAQALFAEKGIDGVAVRDIIKEAGLKNQGSLHYYFGAKDELIQELIADGARLIDERRNLLLDDLESKGGPKTVREITDILVFPSTGMTEEAPFESSYTRFIVLVQQSHPGLFMRALDNQWNSGYQRCLNHLRLLISDIPDSLKNQRFIFIGAMLGSVLSIREKVIVNSLKDVKRWRSDDTLKHLSQIMAVMLEAPMDSNMVVDHADFDKKDNSANALSGPFGLSNT